MRMCAKLVLLTRSVGHKQTVTPVGRASICKIHWRVVIVCVQYTGVIDRQLHWWVVIVCVQYTGVVDSYTGG